VYRYPTVRSPSGRPLGSGSKTASASAPSASVSVVAALAGFLWATAIGAIAILPGNDLPFRHVLEKVFPYGLSLALGGMGSDDCLLYYPSTMEPDWQHAGLSLSLFGVSFVTARLLFAHTINKWGGYRVAIVSLPSSAQPSLSVARLRRQLRPGRRGADRLWFFAGLPRPRCGSGTERPRAQPWFAWASIPRLWISL